MLLRVDKAWDYIGENTDLDSRIETIFNDLFGYPQEAKKTQRIIEYFTPQAVEDPDDEPPRKKLKGISLDEIGYTMAFLGWALGYIEGRKESH